MCGWWLKWNRPTSLQVNTALIDLVPFVVAFFPLEKNSLCIFVPCRFVSLLTLILVRAIFDPM